MPRKSTKKDIVVAGNEALDDRKKEILLTIIKLYLETGEPVGSRTISKKLGMTLSSATIRNEMSDLEEEGYIVKPHTSAGRIPSDKGYRLYVNNLIKEKDDEIKSIKTEMNARVDKLEDMLKVVVKTIAANTNYAAMIAGPSVNNSKIKYVQLSNLENYKVLVVLVAEGNVVKTSIVELDKVIDAKEILDLSMTLNNILSGVRVSDIRGDKVTKEVEKLKKNKKEIKVIIDHIEDVFEEKSDFDNILTYGSNNFFKYKEFAESGNVGSLVEALEQKNELAKIVDKANADSEETGLRVYIGEESSVNAMKDCSIVTANCDFGNGMRGTIGVVGPKRMDYEKVLKTIKNTMQNISKELED
ncbi:MAG: heat-inducible transcription repressor HrcA [Lachnospiraceae bacterium]|nr:heat-inducible transcription repressor HrcA [Lachnospiraceae bacterium]